jgi:hypothetical protein
MYFYLTPEINEKREQLKELLSELKEKELSLYQKKELLRNNGFTPLFVTQLDKSSASLIEFLEISMDEYYELEFYGFLSK